MVSRLAGGKLICFANGAAQAVNVAADESILTAIVASPQRFLHHDMPKGAAGVFEWRTGTLAIPAHD